MWQQVVSRRIVFIFTILTFLQIGLSAAGFDDDFGFDDEDIWTSRVKRDTKPRRSREKRKIGGNRKKVAKRQNYLEIQSGSGEGVTDTEEPGKPKYYRVTFILNEEYVSEFKNSQSKQFSELAQNLGQTIDQLYDPLPGRQSFTLIDVDEVPDDRFQIKVTGDIGTVEFFQDVAIKEILESEIQNGKLGTYTVLEKGFTFKYFQAGDQGSCTRADEIQCRTGALQCLPIDSRCDGKRDCQGGEDEEGCPEIVAPTTQTTTTTVDDDIIDYDVETEVELRPDDSTPSTTPGDVDYPEPIEPEPEPPTTDCRGDNRFTCKDGVTVICDVQKCDGTRDCPQGDDEADCPDVQPTTSQPQCTSEQWACDSRCRPISVRCNKVAECDDDSDEANCPTEPTVDLCEGRGDLFCGELGAGTCTDGECLCNPGYLLRNGKCEVDRCEGRGDRFCGDDGAGRCLDGVCRCNPGYILENGKCAVDRCEGRGDLFCGPYGAGRCTDGVCSCNVGYILRNGKCEADLCEGLGDRFCGADGAGRCSNGVCRCNAGYILQNRKCVVDRCEGRGDRFCGDDGAGSCLDGVCRCNPGYILENRKCAVDLCEGRGDLFCGPAGAGRCIDGVCRCNAGFILDQEECVADPCFGEGDRFCGEPGAGICDRGTCRCNPGYVLQNGKCRKECSSDQFRCNDGSCIGLSRKCDTEFDCPLGEDEEDCRCDEPDQFNCDSTRCIKASDVCNNVADCRDGTDEDPTSCRRPQLVCEPGEWRCGDGTCISIRNRCDGKVDCPNDSSDEGECPCSSDQWQCDLGECIDKSLKCDGKVDCPTDDSDENGCPSPERCRPGQFECYNGQCIDERNRCDGRTDCSDRSDEQGCPPSATSPPQPATRPPTTEACATGDITCGDGKCVSANRICDGVFDCVDGKDERDCSKCRPDEFRCESGRCIPQSRRCDRRNDCPDGSDELDCALECRSDEFTCGDGSCIDVRRVCDRRADCRDGSDERNCRPECRRNEFQCGDGTCIDESRKCDAYRDCADGSDELGCACRSDQFRCGTGQCIDARRRCDRNIDCPDRSDEDPNLCGVSCQPSEFRCRNNQQCVPSSARCNGVVECSDQSDETDCTSAPEDGLNLKTYPEEQSIKQARIGREVVFQCRDEGPIRAPVRWVRGSGLPLPPGSVDRNGRLEMPNIQLDHSGSYFCEAVGYAPSVPGSRVSVYLRVEASEEPTVRPPAACGLNEATCMNGQCVDKSLVCNGKLDCADGSDEMRCPSTGVGCEPNEFQCSNKRCVLKTWRCDGDDDCGDNSDERNCEQAPPGSPCRGDEFRCSTGSQCIPKSFHCDMEIDCQDRSDEIGCAPPTIAIPPPPMLITEVGETFSLNCTAVGKPDPEIVWRLNWGHVPAKCRVTSEAGAYGSYGVITCPYAVESDQGAYSCEAINSKGSTFAIPDAIVVVKPREGVCRNGVFNAAAVTSQDCVPCFCFGITSECSSSNQVVTQLPPPSGQYQIIAVSQDSRGSVSIRSPLSQSNLRTPRVGQGAQVYARDRSSLAGGSDTHVFFNLPPSHRGNQLRSYGGYLKYSIDARGQGRPMAGPDVILAGNGYTLMHYSKTVVQPNRQNEVSVQFWPGEWYKRKSSRPGGDIPSQSDELATREEIMMALQNIEYLLIRATYIDSSIVDTTVTNVRMDTAGDARGDQAVYVEECRCPAGYSGMSCENCAPGYKRASSPWLGVCIEDIPTSCPDGSYGDPGRGIPCQPCPCPHSTGISDEVRTCYLDTDGQVTCNCPAGYEGRRCQQCGAGYTGDPTTGEGCKPVVCNVAGSTSLDLVNGQCQCKTNVEGERCDKCRRGTFGLSTEAPQGCLSCFCSGLTNECGSSSNLYRSNITNGITSQHGFTLSDSNRIVVISEGIRADEAANAVSYTFRGGQTQRLFWSLPPAFTANKLTSYGSRLTVTQFFEERQGYSRYDDSDVILIGNGISIFWINPQPPRAGAPTTYSVPLRENGWVRMDGRASRGSPASREDFLTVLANLEALLVRATFSPGTTRTRLSQVAMGSVVEYDNGEEPAREVEECRCPEGYQGYSCETCQPGFYRDSSDRSYSRLGSCRPCSCSGNEDSCALGENGLLICNCKPGYTGSACETEAGIPPSGGLTEGKEVPSPSISVSVSDSKIQIVQVGSTAYLRCSATSRTSPGGRITLRWTKPGGTLPASRSTDNGRGQLTIYDVQPDDAGTYTCTATDGDSAAYEDAVLRVAVETTQAPPPQPRISISITEPRIQIVQSGQTTRFTCSARSVSNKGGRITLRWSKESGSLPPRRAIDDQRGRLTISDTRPEDAGTYICTASDGVETAYETAVLQVGGTAAKAPVVSLEPSFVDVREGGPVEVRCLADGYPDPVVSWTYGGRNLPRGVTQDDGVLKIAAVRRSDAGEYTCTASNPSGQAIGRITVNVRSAAIIPPSTVFVRVEPRDSIVKRGDSVRLTCSVDAGGESLNPTWTKSTGSISSRGVQSGGVLSFSSVTPADSGIYLCSVTTRSGSVEQAQARITVLAHRGPPTVRVEPEKQTVSQGTGGEIRCFATGDPAPTVRWSKVNEDLSPSIQINGPNLRILSAVIEDRGVYVCTAENAGGVTQAAAVVEVDRREPPTVEMYPSGRQTITNGGSAIFQCRVTQGIPSPKVKWSRQDGRSLPNTVEELPGGVIRFNRVTGDESGNYICTAQNDAGVTTASATLEIQKIPVVTITPSGSYRVSRGQRVRLECRAEGDPIPNVSWKRLRNGVVGEGDSVSSETNYYSIYEIASVTSSDEGAYSCVARNSAGVTEERLQLVVESSIPIGDPNENAIVPRDEIFTVPVGGNAQMSCILADRPSGVTLEWNRADGGSMPYGHYVRDGTLYIDDVQPEASGEYVCEGVNNVGAVVFSLRARLDVIAPPKISIQPIRQVVRPGDQATVYCTATGESPITITWSKISGQLPPSVIVSGGQLQFRSIETTDAGKYVCIAQNSAGTSEATAEVVVNADQAVYSQSKNQTVQAGSDVSLRCDLPWSASLRTVWRRDRGPLPPTAIASGNVLNISNVQVTDSGRYYCEVTTQGGRRSDYVILQVENIKSLPMKITASLDNVQLGDDLELRCEVTGEPSALLSWSRIGGVLPRNVQPLGGVLRVYGVSTEDGGVYRCTAMTSEGRQEEDYVLAIQANIAGDSPPVETKNAPIGSTVVMDCRTNLQPPLTFHWSRQGGALPRDANHQGATLTLPSVRAEDAGTYICTATSAQDSTSLEIPTILSVTGVVPYFLQAPLSYMALPTLPDAYLQFDIEVSFKPEVADGLILYNAQQDGATGDFVAFGLSLGYPEFRFDMGSGPAIIRATTPIQVGKWHTVRLSRNKKDGFMVVDDRPPYVGSASGKFQGLDLLKPLYLGAVPDFKNIHKQAGFTRGFVGCISRLVLSGKDIELSQDAQNSKGVTSCETCAVNPCLNNGVCQEAYAEQGYSCLCTPGFSGYHCEKIGETCYVGGCGAGRCVNEGATFQCYCPFGKTGPRCQQDVTITEPSFRGGAYAAYPTPKALRKLLTNIRFKADDVKDSVILYCSQNEDGQGDFISLAIKDRHLEFRFDTGSGPAILRSERPIKAGEWVTVNADRNLRDGFLSVNDMPVVKGKSPGSMGGLNLKTNLYLGGWDKQKIKISPGVGVIQPFHGCISNITVSGLDLDLIKSVVDSANVENCESPDGACSKNPCQNGGECTETGTEPTDYTCDCPPGFGGQNCERIVDVCSMKAPCQNEGTCQVVSGNDYKCLCAKGWTGKTCEEAILFGVEAGFHGDSYVELDRLLLPHTAPTAAETIAIEFSTTEPNGILFWHGQKPEVDGKALDYLSIAIVDGYVEFSYELGSGPAKIVAQVRVDDGKRHRVVARRTARDGTLEVDNFYVENGQSGGTLQMLNTRGSIYIGGVPNIPLMTGGRHKTGFKGCIHKLSIQADGPIDLYKSSLSTVNVTPCTRYGEITTGKRKSSSEGRGDITFSESSEKDEQQVQVQRVSRNIIRRRRRPRH